jgi:hypothetical protein
MTMQKRPKFGEFCLKLNKQPFFVTFVFVEANLKVERNENVTNVSKLEGNLIKFEIQNKKSSPGLTCLSVFCSSVWPWTGQLRVKQAESAFDP